MHKLHNAKLKQFTGQISV